MAKCRVCGREAWVKIPWGNTWFCREHFIEYFERKVWRTYSRYVPRRHGKILFTLSGGKDSLALLYSLAPRLIDEGYKVSALFIDLGIKGYSDKALEIVRENTDHLGVDLLVVDLGREYGFTIDEIAWMVSNKLLKKPVCSICGMVKRYLYNRVAYEHGYDLVVTGHNLNDVYGFIMTAITTGDLAGLVKMKPYTPGFNGFSAKAKPLFFNYEYENSLYIRARNIKALTAKCPYSSLNGQGLASSYKEQLLMLEKRHPGIGLMFIRNFLEKIIAPISEKHGFPEKLVKCSVCGMPSSSDPCSFCRLRMRVAEIKERS